jgi:hypothetical protein
MNDKAKTTATKTATRSSVLLGLLALLASSAPAFAQDFEYGLLPNGRFGFTMNFNVPEPEPEPSHSAAYWDNKAREDIRAMGDMEAEHDSYVTPSYVSSYHHDCGIGWVTTDPRCATPSTPYVPYSWISTAPDGFWN